MFMPGQTINAALKKVNNQDVTAEELARLQLAFNELNGARVPKPGQRFELPVLERHAK